jgi:hypothetical protein
VWEILVEISILNQPARSVCEWIRLHIMEAAERMIAELCTQLFVIPGALTGQLLPPDISGNTPIEELKNEE